ncbi:hypothetical protein Glove_80g20 [Diversispora epigaea]|uniref:Retrotransposon gag domain-containing protein n=1 Tax=Diversispora epigaea TaxID=1348612 RepID=A0A397JHU0_9GLOM|nr:hypothetical protein Glove_80g20 [Diversispora epigaea]
MRGSWSDFGIRDTINWVDRSSPSNTPPGSPELKPSKIPSPTQRNQSVNEYVKTIKVYVASLGINLNNQDLKGTFFNGLSRENKKEVIRFGFKNSLNEIVDHLNKISTGPTDIQKFRFGELDQGNESVIDYFAKVKKCGKLAGYNGEQLRYFFLRGLSPDNQMEARRCGLELPLDELVERLSALENLTNQDK